MVIAPAALGAVRPGARVLSANWFGDDGRNSLLASLMVVVFGIAVLFGVAWWLLSGGPGWASRTWRSRSRSRRPRRSCWTRCGTCGTRRRSRTLAVLLPATMLPLAFALVDRIEGEPDRRLVLAGIAVCAIGAVVTGLGRDLWAGYADFGYATGILTAGITVIPGFIAAGPSIAAAEPCAAWSTAGPPPAPGPTGALGAAAASAVLPGTEASASGRVLRSAELAIAGFTPAAALLTAPSGAPWLFLAWVGAIAAAGRFTVRPLARLASRAQLQRDLVVAATEAERARVAADIHDDALQELTLLVRRLDAAGDTEGAEIARTVSDRLRAICGDLRLPILDDLGRRARRSTGSSCASSASPAARSASSAPTARGHRPTWSCAIFRIAQEALSNAVKHGAPPILVRYRVHRRGRLALDRRRGLRDPARRRPARRARGPVRAPQHAAAGRGDRRDPRRPALADRRDPRPARVARPVTAAPGGDEPAEAPPIRVAIVDDHPVVRDGTAALLATQPGIAIAGTAGSLEAARDLLATIEADVVLLDIRLGTESGLNLLAGDATHRPAIVVLTAYDYPQYAEAALRLGAAGFVLKTAPMAELLDAIRRAAGGGLAFGVRPRASDRARLSRRELEVVALVVEGRSNDEIGAALGIGAKTVETHLAPAVRAVRDRLADGARDAGAP